METDLGAVKSSFKWRLPVHGPSWTHTVGVISVSYFEETGIFSPSFVMSVAVFLLSTERTAILQSAMSTTSPTARLRTRAIDASKVTVTTSCGCTFDNLDHQEGK